MRRISLLALVLTITLHSASANGNIAENALVTVHDALSTAHDETTIYKGPLSNDYEGKNPAEKEIDEAYASTNRD